MMIPHFLLLVITAALATAARNRHTPFISIIIRVTCLLHFVFCFVYVVRQTMPARLTRASGTATTAVPPGSAPTSSTSSTTSR